MNNTISIMEEQKQILLLHLIKSCINYDLSEKESIETINKILDKDISRRTYYNYKKKLYDKEIFQVLKESCYDTKAVRCLLLDIEDMNSEMSLEADKLIAKQLPDREDVFHDAEQQKAELEECEKTKSMIAKFENQMNEPLKKFEFVPKNSNIRKEFVKCGKENCFNCPHGPYYYAYWRDVSSKKLKKKYLLLKPGSC